MHIVMTITLAWFFYRVTGAWVWPALSVLGGILIDTDHLLDYFFHYGLKFSTGRFLRNTYLDSGKIYVIFHSWEIVFFLLGLSYFVYWLYPLAISMAIHILWDQLTFEKISPRRYRLFKEKGF